MVPTSPEFFCFLLVVFAGYWLLWRNRVAGLSVILIANYFVYLKWGWIYLALVPAASTADFLIARTIDRSGNSGVRRALVAGSVAMNVGLIVLCRYVPFLAGGLAGLTGRTWTAPANWVLPLGLSFYAFQAMTYTIDVYRRDVKPIPSFLTYLCSVSFFPTTLAGPITRVANLAGQFTKKNQVITGEEGATALFLICRGLAKKFLVADYLANNLITRVFDLPTLYSGGEVLVAVYAYAFQIYYDFSAYTDIVTGAAALLGLKLPANFNRPYMARNIADFWRRWHISLSDWLRDYLYFSLPAKRVKIFAYVNLIVTMAIGGLWHGANWTFLIWGLLHGLGLAGYRGWQALRNNPKPSASVTARAVAVLVTFHFVTFAWIFFRAANLENSLAILSQIASLHFAFDNVTRPFWLVLAIAAVVHFTPKARFDWLRLRFVESPALVQAALTAALILAIQYTGSAKVAPFIYTKF
jgi:D-alanyl-lipoteichoic acid acyltransferase DltB (MBOAT superfamily)